MAAKASATLASDNIPIEEQIRQRAYELYLLRGSGPGSAVDDWLQAEEEIRRGRPQSATPAAGNSRGARHKGAA